MAHRRGALAGVLAAVAACATGCDKEVKLTFVNLTADSLDVHVSSPQAPREHVGVLAPLGTLSHELEIDDDDLPATCPWSAGDYRGELRVDKRTPGKVWIDLRPDGPPRVRHEPLPLEDLGKDAASAVE